MNDKKLLLVEDNPDDEKLTLRAFQKNSIGVPIVVARDGAEALELLLGDKAEHFALVLLDLRLPKVHGLKVLERMRAEPRTRLTPVVILTNSREKSDLVQGYSLGANSYVRKPVDFQQLVDVVSKLALYWLVLNEPPPGSQA